MADGSHCSGTPGSGPAAGRLEGFSSSVQETPLAFPSPPCILQGSANFEDRSESFYPMLWMAALGAGRSTPKAEFRAGERPEICWPLVLTSFGAFGLSATGLFALPVSFASVATTIVLERVLIGVLVLITLPVLPG